MIRSAATQRVLYIIIKSTQTKHALENIIAYNLSKPILNDIVNKKEKQKTEY